MQKGSCHNDLSAGHFLQILSCILPEKPETNIVHYQVSFYFHHYLNKIKVLISTNTPLFADDLDATLPIYTVRRSHNCSTVLTSRDMIKRCKFACYFIAANTLPQLLSPRSTLVIQSDYSIDGCNSEQGLNPWLDWLRKLVDRHQVRSRNNC